MNVSQRRKLLDIIKTTTTGKDATLEEIMKLAMPLGYSEFIVQKYLAELINHTFLNHKVIAKSDEFTDAKYTYQWVE